MALTILYWNEEAGKGVDVYTRYILQRKSFQYTVGLILPFTKSWIHFLGFLQRENLNYDDGFKYSILSRNAFAVMYELYIIPMLF